MTITVIEPTGLIHQYRNDFRPRPAFIELDPYQGTLSADWDAEDATPCAVADGRLIRWDIPPLKVKVAIALMNEIVPLTERVVEGHDRVWDGRDHVLALTEDAEAASEEIEEVIRRYTRNGDAEGVVLDEDFLYAGCWDGITGAMSDAEVEAHVDARVAEAMEEFGWAEGDVYVDSALLSGAIAERDRLREDEEEDA